MKSVWQEEFPIKSYEVDSRNRLKMSQLFNYMQEAAGNHANHIGLGYRDLIKENHFWVLSKIKVILDTYPGWGETVKIETWPKAANRLYATRDFLFKNSSDESIGAATTVWLLLDSRTMRPQRVQSLQVLFPENEGKHGLNETLEKIEPAGEFNMTFNRAAAYSDIDINNHVNNEKYVEWILDCFTHDFLVDKQIKAFQLNYLSETKPGEQIVIEMAQDPRKAGCYYFQGINARTQSGIFQSKVEFSD